MNLDKEITLAQLAEVAGLSVFHFARTFTWAMGVSPHRYVSRLRLENAMAEIAAGKLSLAEIAFNAGFSSQASFTRAFYRLSGLIAGRNTGRSGSGRRGRSFARDRRKSAQNTARTGKTCARVAAYAGHGNRPVSPLRLVGVPQRVRPERGPGAEFA